jgi:hypothetical protein
MPSRQGSGKCPLAHTLGALPAIIGGGGLSMSKHVGHRWRPLHIHNARMKVYIALISFTQIASQRAAHALSYMHWHQLETLLTACQHLL